MPQGDSIRKLEPSRAREWCQTGGSACRRGGGHSGFRLVILLVSFCLFLFLLGSGWLFLRVLFDILAFTHTCSPWNCPSTLNVRSVYVDGRVAEVIPFRDAQSAERDRSRVVLCRMFSPRDYHNPNATLLIRNGTTSAILQSRHPRENLPEMYGTGTADMAHGHLLEVRKGILPCAIY